jgi:hypothetical protein
MNKTAILKFPPRHISLLQMAPRTVARSRRWAWRKRGPLLKVRNRRIFESTNKLAIAWLCERGGDVSNSPHFSQTIHVSQVDMPPSSLHHRLHPSRRVLGYLLSFAYIRSSTKHRSLASRRTRKYNHTRCSGFDPK